MHYLDKNQLENNILVLGIYIHEMPTKKLFVQVTSIQQCKYFKPFLLKKILKKPYKLIEKYRAFEFKTETWYLITLKQTDWVDFDIISVEDVSDSPNEFCKLH